MFEYFWMSKTCRHDGYIELRSKFDGPLIAVDATVHVKRTICFIQNIDISHSP